MSAGFVQALVLGLGMAASCMAQPAYAQGDPKKSDGSAKEAVTSAGDAGTRIGMMFDPDVSRTHIVFVYANNLRLVPRQGGLALPLTQPPGRKRRPKFSPDGRIIAFESNSDGHWNLYTLPVGGGTAAQLTHHPADKALCGWTPDGKLLFYTNAFGPFFQRQLCTLSAQGGLPNRLPVPYGVDGAISPDGQWLAYTFFSIPEDWKRYRGGGAPDIWLFHLQNHRAKKITDWEGTDAMPMWQHDRIYYLSDAGSEHRLNLWSYDTKSEQRRQVTRYADYDVKSPSLGPGPNGKGEIVFQHGAGLKLLDLETETARPVEVRIQGDQQTFHPRMVDASKFITHGSLSPSGKQAVLEARGDLWTVPASDGSPHNLTRTSGVAERDPAWSPDGRWIAYFSDATGEYELYIIPADGTGEAQQRTTLGPGFRYRPVWSPNSERIAFTDHTGALYVHTLRSRETKRIDWNSLGDPSQVSWSPNSSWLAYTKASENRFKAIWLYNAETGQAHQVTSGRFNDSWPAFDRKGEYLYFVSARDFSSPTFDSLYSSSFVYASVDSVLAVPLRHDTRFPNTPQSNEDEPKGSSESIRERSDERGDRRKTRPAIDLEGFERRASPLPASKAQLRNLAVAHDGKLIYGHAQPTGEQSVRILDPSRAEKAEEIVITGTDDFQLSADGRKLLVRKGEIMAIVDAASDQKIDPPLNLAGMIATINPREEWRQIFTEAWRYCRDFFYDANLHHVDWPAVRRQYRPLLDRCSSREDLNSILNDMFGELNSSHVWLWRPGDVEQPRACSVGMLGVDFTLDQAAYRIAKIYEGAPWEVDARNPLRQPGINVKEGTYLLAVNHVPLDTTKDPWAAFLGLAGRAATLTVSTKPTIDAAARDVVVRLLENRDFKDEGYLRYRAWVEHNRACVERQSGGRVGYLHVPNTWDMRELVSQFSGQMIKEALIIDERWNTGGRGPDRMVELLNRPAYSQETYRHGPSWHYPQFSHQGPKCMLINGGCGSGGDNFPYQFRRAGLGKLIGTRTRGGLLGGTGAQPFIDGGRFGLPVIAPYDANGKWVIEGGPGVQPDIEVIDNPALMVNGRDPQLDAAIKLMLEEIQAHPAAVPRRPPSPDRRGMGSR
jgi:tricorn protease